MKQPSINIKSAAATSVRADRAFAKSRREKLSSQLKSQNSKNNAKKMEVALTLISAHLAMWQPLDEDQTQLLQQELVINCKTIYGQSQELTERGQQLITARLEKRNKQWWHTISRRHCAGKICNMMRAHEVELSKEQTKKFGGNAECENGKGMSVMHYMQTFHQKAYLYPIARACGGSRQDVETEGAIPALMNTYSILFRIS